MLCDALDTVWRISTKFHRIGFVSELAVLPYSNPAAVHGYLLHGIMSEWLVLPRP
jgi:hypothetical protein